MQGCKVLPGRGRSPVRRNKRSREDIFFGARVWERREFPADWDNDAREARETFLEEGAGLGLADCVAQDVGAGGAGASRAIFAGYRFQQTRAVLVFEFSKFAFRLAIGYATR